MNDQLRKAYEELFKEAHHRFIPGYVGSKHKYMPTDIADDFRRAVGEVRKAREEAQKADLCDPNASTVRAASGPSGEGGFELYTIEGRELTSLREKAGQWDANDGARWAALVRQRDDWKARAEKAEADTADCRKENSKIFDAGQGLVNGWRVRAEKAEAKAERLNEYCMGIRPFHVTAKAEARAEKAETALKQANEWGKEQSMRAEKAETERSNTEIIANAAKRELARLEKIEADRDRENTTMPAITDDDKKFIQSRPLMRTCRGGQVMEEYQCEGRRLDCPACGMKGENVPLWVYPNALWCERCSMTIPLDLRALQQQVADLVRGREAFDWSDSCSRAVGDKC